MPPGPAGCPLRCPPQHQALTQAQGRRPRPVRAFQAGGPQAVPTAGPAPTAHRATGPDR